MLRWKLKSNGALWQRQTTDFWTSYALAFVVKHDLVKKCLVLYIIYYYTTCYVLTKQNPLFCNTSIIYLKTFWHLEILIYKLHIGQLKTILTVLNTLVHDYWRNRNGFSKPRCILVYEQVSRSSNIYSKMYWKVEDKSKIEISVVERSCAWVLWADSYIALNVCNLWAMHIEVNSASYQLNDTAIVVK